MSMTDDFYEIIDDINYPYELRIMLSTMGHDLTYLNYFIKQFENKKSILKIDETIRDIEKRRFYDEREWRYIPFEAENKNELFLKIEDFNNPIKLVDANNRLKEYKLSFEYEGISCLIVQSEKEKQELHEIVKKTFGKVKILIQ